MQSDYSASKIYTQKKTTFLLPSGSLLLMLGKQVQEQFTHALPKDKNCKEERWNLNFRLHKYNK